MYTGIYIVFLQILKSKTSGQDGNDVYTPTAYWYPLLSFLDSSTAADKSVSNFDTLVSETQNTDFEELVSTKQFKYVYLAMELSLRHCKMS